MKYLFYLPQKLLKLQSQPTGAMALPPLRTPQLFKERLPMLEQGQRPIFLQDSLLSAMIVPSSSSSSRSDSSFVLASTLSLPGSPSGWTCGTHPYINHPSPLLQCIPYRCWKNYSKLPLILILSTHPFYLLFQIILSTPVLWTTSTHLSVCSWYPTQHGSFLRCLVALLKLGIFIESF